MEHPVRRIVRLEDRNGGTAGDVPVRGDRAVGVQARLAADRAVPGHVRMTPLDPGEAPAVRRQRGHGVEVRTLRQRRHGAVRGDGDETVLRLALRPARRLGDRDQPAACRVHGEVRIGRAIRRRDGDDLAARFDAVHALVARVHEPDAAVMGGDCAAAILVRLGPDIVGRGGQIAHATVRGAAHQDRAPLLPGPLFGPQDGVAVEQDLAEPDGSAGQQIRRDRRAPAAERGAGLLRHAERPFDGWRRKRGHLLGAPAYPGRRSRERGLAPSGRKRGAGAALPPLRPML